MNDNICTECFEEDEEKKNPLPGKTGQVLNPLKKKRRRTMNHPIPVVTLAKKSRGRPRKLPSKTSEKIVDLVKDATNSETVDVNDNIATGEGMLSELRLLGSNNILAKVFVSEALTCDDPVEAHLFDILGAGKPLPCYYCGELEQNKLFSLLTEDSFPLCQACQQLGKGPGARRKSRVIKPKPVKVINKVKKKVKAVKRKKLID